MLTSTPRIQTLTSKYYSPLKGATPLRELADSRDILDHQKIRKHSKNDGDKIKDTEAHLKGHLLAKLRTTEVPE